VDGGQDTWRLDAAQVVQAFASDGLDWKGPVLESGGCFGTDCPFDTTAQAFTVHFGCLTCPGVVVEVQRLVRPGETGIWSVTRVAGNSLTLPMSPGATVESGSTVTETLIDPGTERVLAGYTYIGECSGLSSFASPAGGGFFGGQVQFQVAGSSFVEYCESPGSGGGSSASGGSSAGGGPGLLAQPVDGAIWVATVSSGTADFDPFARGPQDNALVEDLAAVPVHFRPGGVTRTDESGPRALGRPLPARGLPVVSGRDGPACARREPIERGVRRRVEVCRRVGGG
jgi:hypothetical protein